MIEMLELPTMPYRGLESFRLQDREIFAGRDEEIESTLKLILQYRGVIMYGATGIGKSSLIAAGLIPKIIAEGIFTTEIVRLDPEKKGSFVITRIRTGEEGPFRPSVFDSFAKNENDPKINISIESFRRLMGLFKGKRNSKTARSIPVLFFDQFEELVTLFEENIESDEKLEIQATIIELLAECFYDETLRMKFIFTFREDYLAKFDRLFYAIPDIRNYCIYIRSIDKKNISSIIERPFDSLEKLNHFTNPFDKEVIEMITSRLTKHFTKTSLDLTDAQIVCSFLYKSETTNAKRIALLKRKTITEILEGFYLDLVAKIPDGKRSMAMEILSMLVLNERTRNIYHEDAIIAGIGSNKRENTLGVLKLLESSIHLIRTEKRYGGLYYEIVSEAIIPHINRINQDRDQRRKERELEARNKQEIDRIKSSKWRAVGMVLIVSLAAILTLAFYGLINYIDTTSAINEIKAADIQMLEIEMNISKRQDTAAYKSDDSDLEANDQDARRTKARDKAIEQYNTALEQAPTSLKTIIFPKIITALLENEDFKGAIKLYKDRAHEDQEKTYYFYVMLGQLSRSNESNTFALENDFSSENNSYNIDSARREILKIGYENRLENDPNFMSYLARNLFDAKMDSLCLVTLQKIKIPDNWEAITLGEYYEQGIGESVKPNFRKAEALYKTRTGSDFKARLAGVYMQINDSIHAKDYLKPLSKSDIRRLGMIFFRRALNSNGKKKRHNYMLAGIAIENVIEDFKDDVYLRSDLGNCYARQDRYSEALAQFKAGLALDPNNARLLNSCAWWTTKAPHNNIDLIEALKRSERSIDLPIAPWDRANYIDTKAEILYLLGRHKESREACLDAQRYIDRLDPAFVTTELRDAIEQRLKKLEQVILARHSEVTTE